MNPSTAFASISTPAGPLLEHAPAWNRQRRSGMPSNRYTDAYSRVEVPLAERDWPTRRLEAAPLWVPVDLRDGNQARAEPMDPDRKRRFFELMVAMGYKEIEVGYPSASQTDYDFVRLNADTDIAPDDVTIVVFTPARRDLIERTVASMRGIANPVVIHMYTATAPTWRDMVLGRTPDELRRLILAGAQRVEGCIFGNGERTGNVDVATLALNLHAQGIDPMIDFSDIDEIRRPVEHCNRIEVHARQPYVGDLVHTAFSGTHQDAIKKGFAEHLARAAAEGVPESEVAWRVPYLPIDPADIGRDYDAVFRVNSQSGKGGIAYLLETEYGIELPRRLQIDLARRVKRRTDDSGVEITAAEIWSIFEEAYLAPAMPRVELLGAVASESGERSCTTIELRIDGERRASEHDGVGPVEALAAALHERGIDIEVLDLHQSSIGAGNAGEAISLIEYRDPAGTGWAAGRDRSVLGASLRAVVAAANLSGSYSNRFTIASAARSM